MATERGIEICAPVHDAVLAANAEADTKLFQLTIPERRKHGAQVRRRCFEHGAEIGDRGADRVRPAVLVGGTAGGEIGFGQHEFDVLFSGEVGPTCASLWVWATNYHIDADNAYKIANSGGRARQSEENVFNVQKNGGFGLEHAFCANDWACWPRAS